MDVAIIGVGLHPFGRFGERTGIDMGAIAIRRALADAGVAWRDIQFAFAGSYEIDNPDAVVALLGLTGLLSFLMGLLAEICVRTYFESQGRRPYVVQSVYRRDAGERRSERT